MQSRKGTKREILNNLPEHLLPYDYFNSVRAMAFITGILLNLIVQLSAGHACSRWLLHFPKRAALVLGHCSRSLAATAFVEHNLVESRIIRPDECFDSP